MKRTRTPALLTVVAALGVGAMFVGSASAHTSTTPTVSCSQASASLLSFPAGTHTVTFSIVVNGVTTSRTATFTGTAGTATVTISDLTAATGPLTISAQASWTDDGGGTSTKTSATLTCHEPATTTTTQAPTPAATPPPAVAKFTG